MSRHTRYLTTAEAAQIMNCHEKTVLHRARLFLATRGKRGLRGYQPSGVNGSWRFTESDIDTFMRAGVSS